MPSTEYTPPHLGRKGASLCIIRTAEEAYVNHDDLTDDERTD